MVLRNCMLIFTIPEMLFTQINGFLFFCGKTRWREMQLGLVLHFLKLKYKRLIWGHNHRSGWRWNKYKPFLCNVLCWWLLTVLLLIIRWLCSTSRKSPLKNTCEVSTFLASYCTSFVWFDEWSSFFEGVKRSFNDAIIAVTTLRYHIRIFLSPWNTFYCIYFVKARWIFRKIRLINTRLLLN